jgi:hypothetical protein
VVALPALFYVGASGECKAIDQLTTVSEVCAKGLVIPVIYGVSHPQDKNLALLSSGTVFRCYGVLSICCGFGGQLLEQLC